MKKNGFYMVMIKTLLLVSLFCFLPMSAKAQSWVTMGTVIDENGEPIIGATVLEQGTTNGTQTDFDGNFKIKVHPNSKLIFSYVGCLTETLNAVNGRLNVVLKTDAKLLEDVVVIGYGTVKKQDATGSVTAIKPDDFNKGNRVTAQDALVGQMPGVNVVAGSGAPGDGATIRIRSGASLSASNDPLIVIDGVPVDNSEVNGSSNIISTLNPEDIESFTVLKDASATAIYGSRASNGVIVITTKKGTDRLVVNYTSNYSISTVAKKLDVLTGDEFRAFVPTVTGVPADLQYGTENTDWQDAIFRTAFGTEQNVSVSGKIKAIKSPWRVSAGYTNQNGIIRENNYERFTVGGSIAPSLFDDHLTANLNIKFSYEDNKMVDNSVVNNALRYDPTRPIMTGSPTSATDPGLGYFIWTNGGSPMAIQTDNPVAQIELSDNVNKILRSIGSAAISYKIHGLEDLKVNLNLGYDVLESKYNQMVPELAGMMYTGNMKDGTGLDYKSTQKKRNYLLDFYLNYDKLFNDVHQFGIMAGYGWQHFWKKMDSTTNDTEGNELFSPYHMETENYLVSFYGRANYAFDNRYLLTATLRADASSRFAKNNRWGLFPSVAAAWRIVEEDFLKDQNVLSDLKLRLGYGVTGQQDILNDYPYMTTFSVSYPESSYFFGDTWYQTIRPNGYDNDIKWETTTTYNVGIDYGFLNNRIYGSIDYYKRYTKDLLNTINVISGTNFSSVITTNIGKMENQGVEFAINAVPVKTRDWEWTVGFNYTWNDSKITKLNTIDKDNYFVETGAISGTGKFVQCFMVNERPYTFYLAEQAYDENGKPLEGKYIQEDGSVGTTEYRKSTGKSALPTHYIGFNTRLSYKNWDFAISGHGSFGHYIYNYVKADQYVESVYSDQGNCSNILQSTMETGFHAQQLYSDYWLEKGDFFRVDNITIGYTFPRLWNTTSSLRLTLGVSNVFTITGYDGLDPDLSYGIDREVYPRPRTFNLGVNLKF